MILALKLVLTPALIAAATLVGRRFGPSISGWLVGLPLTSGPVSLFLALEQGTTFAATAASGFIAGVMAAAVYALVYVGMARRFGWPGSVSVASLAFARGRRPQHVAAEQRPPFPLLALTGRSGGGDRRHPLIPRPGALERAPSRRDGTCPPWPSQRLVIASPAPLR